MSVSVKQMITLSYLPFSSEIWVEAETGVFVPLYCASPFTMAFEGQDVYNVLALVTFWMLRVILTACHTSVREYAWF